LDFDGQQEVINEFLSDLPRLYSQQDFGGIELAGNNPEEEPWQFIWKENPCGYDTYDL